MSAADIVGAVMDAIQMGDFETAFSYLSDDFLFSGPVPQPVSAEQWIGVNAILREAFPDLAYNFDIDGAEGNQVSVSAALTGTHTGNLDLRPLGFGFHAPTGRTFTMAREYGVATVDGDQIVSWDFEPSPDSGMPAIFSQLGLRMPAG